MMGPMYRLLVIHKPTNSEQNHGDAKQYNDITPTDQQLSKHKERERERERERESGSYSGDQVLNRREKRILFWPN